MAINNETVHRQSMLAGTVLGLLLHESERRPGTLAGWSILPVLDEAGDFQPVIEVYARDGTHFQVLINVGPEPITEEP